MEAISYLIFKVETKEGIMPNALDDVELQIGNRNGELLHLIIQSYGGYPYSAVRIMNMLQSRFKKIIAVIPNQAMSAATLMALGTDVIYMDDKSSLGPLDLPIEHPKDGSDISALDVQNTITTISSLAETIAADRYKFLRNEKKLSKTEAAKLALVVANEFVKPIVEQIDPYHLQKSYRELRIGLHCGYRLLLSRMMKGDWKKAINSARALVNDYPSHDYAISPLEASEVLNLKIEDLAELSSWPRLKTEFEKYTNQNYVIKYGELPNVTQELVVANVSAQQK